MGSRALPQTAAKGNKGMLASLGLRLSRRCQFLTLPVKKIPEGIIKKKGDCHHCRLIRFLKASIFKAHSAVLYIMMSQTV
jgi:hypothetical protein